MNEKPNPWTTAAPLSAAVPRDRAGHLPTEEAQPPDGASSLGEDSSPLTLVEESSRTDDARIRDQAHALPDEELHAILGSGTSFHGTLSFSGRVRIDGEFSGQLLGGRTLIVGEGAKIQGELRADHVIVLGGQVKADIYANQAIELYVPAQVSGDLRAPEIHMDKGIRFVGTCDLSAPERS